MDLRIARATVLLGCVVLVAIRAPHGQRSRKVRVRYSRKGTREIVLLTLAWMSFFLPLFWAIKPFAFGGYPLHPVPYAAGVLGMATGLWLFHRSHADLGTNWSITLEVREEHRLVTNGIYRRIRHPMYAALLLYSVGQALALPNWLAGPSYLIAISLLIALRVGPEERMMREEFGGQYDTYASRTKRIVPGVW